MKDNKVKRAIAYGIGVIIVVAWAIFRIIPYFYAMLLTTGILIFCLLLESEIAIQENNKKEANKKRFLGTFLFVLLVISVFMLMIQP